MIDQQQEAPSRSRTALIQKPPQTLDLNVGLPSLFLAGSIEQGVAEDWQSKVISAFERDPILLLSPRRDHWDSTWKQHKDDPNFRGQVTWELDAQEGAGTILMYFEPKTKSPITLLELGLFASTGKLVVCCPEGFESKQYVDAVCERYGVPMVKDLPTLIAAAKYAVSDPEGFKALLRKPDPDQMPQGIFFSGGVEVDRNTSWISDVYRHLFSRKEVLIDESKGEPRSLDPATLRARIAEMEQAERILLNFDAKTKSPSALLELGLYARSGKLVVRCEEGYWRKGNVEIVCERYGIPTVAQWDERAVQVLARSNGRGSLEQ